MYLAKDLTDVKTPLVGIGKERSCIVIADGAAGNAFVIVIDLAVPLHPFAFCACTVMAPTAPIPAAIPL
jgi:hypothetical protein